VFEWIPSNTGRTGRWRGGWTKTNCEAMAEKQLDGQRKLASGKHKMSVILINHKLCIIIYTTSNSKQFNLP